MDPPSLYRDVMASESALRELLRSQACGSPNALYLRSTLMEKAESFVSKCPGLAASKEIEQVLWKPCFYKRIEDFRRRIRKYASQSGNDRSIRDHFFKLSDEFQAFLDQSAAYYERLHEYFVAADPTHDGEALRHSMFRCLIFLGDIARYRELHSQKAKKNFIAAEGYYHRALQIMPENGNPHNQLAVLATYIEAETIAVYRYCRSLLLPHPFATAEENLSLLFERSRHRALSPTSSTSISAQSPPKEKSAFLKAFLHRLTRLHGILYAPTADETYPLELEASICSDFQALLAAGVLGDALVLKLFVINIFCITRSSAMQAHAVKLTLALMSIVLDCVAEKRMLLGPVGVLGDFFRLHPRYLDVAPPSLEWKTSLVKVLNECCVVYAASHEEYEANKGQLKESIELRCFEPLGTIPNSSGSTGAIPEADAWPIRCANLLRFASFLVQERILYERDGQYSTTPPPPSIPTVMPPMPSIVDNGRGMEDEDDFDDEVIVFQPVESQQSASSSAFIGSPSFGSVDLSAFRNLGGGLRPMATQDVLWQPNAPSSSASVWQEPSWTHLEAVEQESTRYEHQASSLSLLFEQTSQSTKKTTKSPPPGFAPVVTRNPFVVGGHPS
ncbi:hypothetical protein AC1031_003344 [Aphanomyces cochlioides]|nr:hypothetical protein AC1031_003344 [Aphanomyces cochlioides]